MDIMIAWNKAITHEKEVYIEYITGKGVITCAKQHVEKNKPTHLLENYDHAVTAVDAAQPIRFYNQNYLFYNIRLYFN